MKGNQKVIGQLQKLLRGELAARDQYFTHSRMYEDWGLSRLYERINHEMEDETQHADALIKRLLFLETTPDLSEQDALRIGSDVPTMLKNDLDVEYGVIAALKEAIAICEAEQDFQTREILESMLADTEEDHKK
ncbi:MAG: bacterioferritin [gamma proteobacterium symbiont of Ctena orbiculata]